MVITLDSRHVCSIVYGDLLEIEYGKMLAPRDRAAQREDARRDDIDQRFHGAQRLLDSLD